jgi:hypothetical protein
MPSALLVMIGWKVLSDCRVTAEASYIKTADEMIPY